MNKPAKFPTHDQAKDGNRFEWILQQAAVLRARQQEEQSKPRPRFNHLMNRAKDAR